MLDLKIIRENPDKVKKAVQDKNFESDIDAILKLDSERREILVKVEELKHRRNIVSDEIAKLKKNKQNADSLIAEMKVVSDTIKSQDDKVREIETQLEKFLLTVPNIPHPSVPIGKTPQDNVEIFKWGKSPEADFKLKTHWEITERLGIIDFEKGAKITGSGFPVYIGYGAKLQRALINFFLDEAESNGYKEVWPPIMVNEDSARGTGQIPDKEDLMYIVERDKLYLIPTAEVPVTNIYRNEILKEKELPVKLCAYTPCFRREAGSYGKDVRGLNRLHQFDKVELVKFVHPSKSYDELESLRQDAEKILQKLELPYRVLLMCTGDMGFTQTKKYDLEIWSPAQQKWLEVSSCSNFEDFQARRANIRFKPEAGGKTEFVHTLNGSGLALPRIVAGIIENYQTDEGTVIVPPVLRKYLNTEMIGKESK